MVSSTAIVKIGLLFAAVVAFGRLQGFELLGSGIREVKNLRDSVTKVSDERTSNLSKRSNNRRVEDA